MREAFLIAGKIATGQATERDRVRLQHLLADKAASMRKPLKLRSSLARTSQRD